MTAGMSLGVRMGTQNVYESVDMIVSQWNQRLCARTECVPNVTLRAMKTSIMTTVAAAQRCPGISRALQTHRDPNPRSGSHEFVETRSDSAVVAPLAGRGRPVSS